MAGDPHYSSVSLLLHGDGTNGSTTVVDSSPVANIATAYGNAQISTAQSVFGGASLYLDGTGDRVQFADSSVSPLGTSDFTIEFWVMPSTPVQLYPCPLASGSYNTGSWAIQLGRTGVGLKVQLWVDNFSIGAAMMTGATTLSTSAFTHVAITRVGTAFVLWVSGVSDATATSAANMRATSEVLVVGGDSAGSATSSFAGYIDDLRITKGVARYTSTFTPPTAAFSDYAGQVSGIVRDSSNAPCLRTVRAYDRTTGALVGTTTSNATTGVYTLNCASTSEVSIVCLDDVAGTTENDLILRTTPV